MQKKKNIPIKDNKRMECEINSDKSQNTDSGIVNAFRQNRR